MSEGLPLHKTSIVFLWAEITPYIQGTLRKLAESYRVNVDIIYWDKKTNNNGVYIVEDGDKVKFHLRSKNSVANILDFLKVKRPRTIVVSGWMDKGYISACKTYKKIYPETDVIAALDTQWDGNLRQRFGQLYFNFILKPLFQFIWVPGVDQMVFAQRLGYKLKRVIPNLYSGNYCNQPVATTYLKRFLYVGRMIKLKGVDLLISAHKGMETQLRNAWPLVLVGSGELQETIKQENDPYITHIPFLQPEDLVRELSKGGVGCMPSRSEHWGVAIHEFTQFSLPLLLSDCCGAGTDLLIPGYNGMRFQSQDVRDLRQKMVQII